jgi:predicted transcriptional regulator
MEGGAYLTAVIPAEHRIRLQELAREHDRSLSGEVRRAISAYLTVTDETTDRHARDERQVVAAS